jgi:ADP-dependent NAD(P)H-hydrate dehydratase / NAD(P)H-hydrate epimerase
VIAAHDVAAVRAAEAAVMAALPPGALMQRAAAALAAACAGELRSRRGLVSGSRVVLLVGRGGNGGDALWAGARLARRGARVDALLATDSVHAPGLEGLRAAGGRVHERFGFGLLERADLVVDGLLGIGGRGGLRERAAALAGELPPGPVVVAVDLPSGVDADTGQTPGACVVADLTVTFGTAKACLLVPPGSAAAGRVRLADIGLGPHLGEPVVERLEDADAAALWPVPGASDHKYSRGVVGVVAGSATYTGAAVLATGAAVRAGAGMVRYVGPEHPTELVRTSWPEVVPGDGRVQAWALGSGVDAGGHDGQDDAVRRALASDLPCVVDAGALGLLVASGAGPRGAPTLLTPHAGELARLLGQLGRATTREDVDAAPLALAREAARRTGATVLLKGATTLVVPPQGPARAQADAPAWLATAGAGDVLAGVAATLLAAGLDPVDAGSLASLVHGRAAARASGGGPVSASAVAEAVPAEVAALLG